MQLDIKKKLLITKVVYKGMNCLRRREPPAALRVPAAAGRTLLAGWAPCTEQVKFSDHQAFQL